MFLHIDGDIVVYRCGFAAEKMHYFLSSGEEFESAEELNTFLGCSSKERELILQERGLLLEKSRIAEPVENALYNVKSVVSDIVDKLEVNPELMCVYLSGSTNFRTELAKQRVYKGNRDPNNKPIHGPAIKEYITKKYNTLVSDGEEADDLIGQRHWAMYKADPLSTCIVSIDKDLLTIPGLHYNFVRQENHFVKEDEALRRFYEQLISGDPVDNIPGIPNVGKKGAAEALVDCTTEEEMYTRALSLYVQSYGQENGKDVLVEQARLVYIRRLPGEMWLPPGERENNVE